MKLRHRWLFISESLELLDKEKRKGADSLCLMDQLRLNFNVPCSQEAYKLYIDRGYIGQMRPLLTMRRIQSIQELYFFFEHLGRHVYYCATQPEESPDWTLIEEVLVNDFLEPRSNLFVDDVVVNSGGSLLVRTLQEK